MEASGLVDYRWSEQTSSDNPLCREESSRMLFYAAQGVSCAARVRKPLTSGTSSKPKVLNPTARAASQESRVFDTKNCLVGF